MDEENTKPPCEFDRLFTKSVPHILEKIFFSLDYDSLMSSRLVCKAWNELHSAELYRQQALNMFQEKKKQEDDLCRSSERGNVEEVRQLLSSGVNPNCENAFSASPLDCATCNGHKEVAKVLLNAGANPNTIVLVGIGHWEMVKLKILLDAGADPNKVGYRGEPPLHRAAYFGKIEMVKLLLGGGADPNKVSADGKTPLHRAIIGGWEDQSYVVKQLLDAGADPNKGDKYGCTPLYWANRCHQYNMVKLLLERGADRGTANKRLKFE